MRASMLLLFSSLSGCIISVTSHRQCNAERLCPIDFSCRDGECVADGALGAGESCSAPVQCEDYPTMTCGTDPETCRLSCGALLGEDDVCAAGEYCRAERHILTPDRFAGTCVESECARNWDCSGPGAGLRCVELAPDIGACLPLCAITGVGATYSDTCDPMLTPPLHCQPVGLAAAQSLVCLPRLKAVTAAPDLYEVCDPVRDPCKPGLVCVGPEGEKACQALCELENGNADCTDPNAALCCGVYSGGTLLYGICRASGC
ncbi:MAG: hypothetical protein HY903_16280 [Deltaproteobacteria bacterium]|nr:hypothetical protein [Deltaproteobacteria bacterium]